MTRTTTVATFVMGAVGSVGMAFVSVLPRNVTVSRYALSHRRHELRVSGRGPSNVVAVVGRFEINYFKYCGCGPGRMKVSSIVTPRT